MAKNDFYSSNRLEIDIRKEFQNTMYGSRFEIAKSQPGLLRRFRKDSSNQKIRCSCVDPVTDEPLKDSQCPVCKGEKYLWDEEDLDFYVTQVQSDPQLASRENLRPPGTMNTPLYVFFIPSDFSLTEDDKIVRLELDKEGVPLIPKRRRELFKITSLHDLRLDNARLEYWKANGYVDNPRFL